MNFFYFYKKFKKKIKKEIIESFKWEEEDTIFLYIILEYAEKGSLDSLLNKENFEIDEIY